jgi:hypothetical protein
VRPAFAGFRFAQLLLILIVELRSGNLWVLPPGIDWGLWGADLNSDPRISRRGQRSADAEPGWPVPWIVVWALLPFADVFRRM